MINKNWDSVLNSEYKKDYFIELRNKVHDEYNNKIIFPPYDKIFNAFLNTSYDDIKVVIIGQDPYHGVGEAEGLSFSVGEGIKLPPSLKNIFKELKDDLGFDAPISGSLIPWAKQGVLLLNAVLTVEKDKPASHKNLGWQQFTDSVISKINERNKPVVFILWGNFAKEKKVLINNPIHCIIESAHPSPFSARNGFFGSKPFSKTNQFLIKNNMEPVNWKL